MGILVYRRNPGPIGVRLRMRQTHQAWLRSAASLAVVGAALAGALPAVAGSVSFSVNMTSEEVLGQVGNVLDPQILPFTGTMPPFGNCRSEGTVLGSSASTMVFTRAQRT